MNNAKAILSFECTRLDVWGTLRQVIEVESKFLKKMHE